MKKKLIVFLVFAMMSAGLYAQQPGQSTFGFRLGMARGLAAGLESDSWSSWDNGTFREGSWEESNRFNFNVALYYAYTFAPNMSLQVELNFMVYQGIDFEAEGRWEEDWWDGWNHHWDSGSWSDSWYFTYTSLDIPILIRYNFFNGLLGVLVGPHISIPIAGDTSGLNTTFGATIGGQGLLPLWGGRIVGDLRFIADFNRLADGYRVRRQALVLTVGYERSL